MDTLTLPGLLCAVGSLEVIRWCDDGWWMMALLALADLPRRTWNLESKVRVSWSFCLSRKPRTMIHSKRIYWRLRLANKSTMFGWLSLSLSLTKKILRISCGGGVTPPTHPADNLTQYHTMAATLINNTDTEKKANNTDTVKKATSEWHPHCLLLLTVKRIADVGDYFAVFSTVVTRKKSLG